MLGKILLSLVFVGAVAIGIYTFTRGDSTKVSTESNADFTQIGNGKRGDDPLYSEEIRRNTALTLESRDRADRLQQGLDEMKQQNRNGNKRIEQLTSTLNDLKADISALKNGNAPATEVTEEMKQELDDKLTTIQETIDRISDAAQSNAEQNQRKISELEAALAVQSEQPNTYTGATQANLASRGGAITYAYGRGAQTIGADNNLADKISSSLDSVGNLISGGSAVQDNGEDKVPTFKRPEKKEWSTVFPVYTLPPNTVLADSTLITPIIGRVPLPGAGGTNNVSDPFFFKVEVGSENLAANGQKIPSIAKVIASGYSTGVREQSCVRGYIDSLTFIFIDGRIVTHGKNSGDGSSNNDAIGYLADKWGKPCIRGHYINNAKDYLMSRGMAAFVEAAAAGLSQSQVDTQQNNDGTKQAILSGNVWQYILGQGISGSAGEVAEYIRERTANAFDVVYVEQAQPVQIWLNEMIPIDYDSKARKISYYDDPQINKQYD